MKIKIALILLVTVFAYQNCGDTGFLSNGSGQTSLSSESILKVENQMADTSDYQIVQIRAMTEGMPNVKTLFWDHIFEDDVEFCEQTSSDQNRVVTFLCPKQGKLQVFLSVTLFNDEVLTEKLVLNLDSTQEPKDPDDPIIITPEQLYETNCMGCHGALATSTKRGITMSRLNNGLNSVSTMAFLKLSLTQEDKQAIVDVLQ